VDSEIVRRLREAGAIPLGRTNVPELELWPFTESEAWGATRNPWNPQRSPGGSSGGSAAAVAAGMVPAATGSDGMGSIRIPAACCGIFGVKTQRGRISMKPLVDPWHGLSVLGPLTRRVADAALLLDLTADGSGPPLPGSSFAHAAATAPPRLRVAVAKQVPAGVVARIDRQVLAAMDRIADALRGLGHDAREAKVPYGTSLTHAIVRYLRGGHDSARELDASRLEPRSKGFVRLGGLIPDGLLAAARGREDRVQRHVWRIFDDFDVVLAPILLKPVIEVGQWDGRGAIRLLDVCGRYTPYGVWNLLGNPCAAVPAGFDDRGTPIGLQLVGRANDEATLLSLSAQLEAELGWPGQRPPLAL
jgi:amidase